MLCQSCGASSSIAEVCDYCGVKIVLKEISKVANAAVVGSHIVKIIENEYTNNKNNLFNVEKVLKEVKTHSLGLN